MTREQKIFKEVAEAYLTPRRKRTRLQDNIAFSGLCYGCAHVGNVDDYSLPNIFAPKGKSREDHWISPDLERNDDIRGLFALFLAEMPEKDFKELYENN